jgi:hypothetical protein
MTFLLRTEPMTGYLVHEELGMRREKLWMLPADADSTTATRSERLGGIPNSELEIHLLLT